MPEDAPQIIGPSSHFYVSQRLKLHYVDWGNEAAPPLLLIHGGRDHARSWDWVARDLRADYHVIAPDLRGHGDSAWAIGGMYAITDFVLDVAQLFEALGVERIAIVAHSLGGAVALHFAGVYPEKVTKLVAIEGMGPPPGEMRRLLEGPLAEQLGQWISSMQRLAGRWPRHYKSIDEAAQRMQEENPFLSEAQARHLTIHGVARNEDGTFSWKFDNYVRALPPYRLDEQSRRGLWARIDCPTLLIRGTESWVEDPERDGRVERFQNAHLVSVEGAGHWVHHDRLDEFLRLVREFLAA